MHWKIEAWALRKEIQHSQKEVMFKQVNKKTTKVSRLLGINEMWMMTNEN